MSTRALPRRRPVSLHNPIPAAGEVTVRDRTGAVVRIEPALDASFLPKRERGTIPASLRSEVMDRDLGRCRYCRTSTGRVARIVTTGTNALANVVACCHRCKARKGAAAWVPGPLDKHLEAVGQEGGQEPTTKRSPGWRSGRRPFKSRRR